MAGLVQTGHPAVGVLPRDAVAPGLRLPREKCGGYRPSQV